MIKNTKQRGSALIYILIAIALLAALTATFMDSSSTQTSNQSAFNLEKELNSQIQFIASAIDECVLTYPSGDTTMPNDPVGAAAQGQYPVRPYPLMPNNNYMSSPTVGLTYAKDIRCPGNPGNSNNHVKIFSGITGKHMPPPVKLFRDWYYYNNVDGVFIETQTAVTDAFIDEALKRVDAKFSKCEVQYVNNNTGSTIYYTSDGYTGWNCQNGRKCLIVRLRTSPSTIYPGEVGCP